MKKIAIACGLAVVLAAIGLGAYLMTRTYEIRMTESDIQGSLEKALPFEKTYFIVATVKFDEPRVKLQQGSDRIGFGIRVGLGLKLKEKIASFEGTVDASSGIEYRAEESAFYLIDPLLEDLKIDGVPKKYLPVVKKAVQKGVSTYLQSRPAYTLKATDVKKAAAKLLLQDLRIEDGEMVIVLGLS